MFDAVTYGAAVGAAKKYTDEHSGSDDAVKYTEQSLTSEQQAQARENIGAAASDDIPTDAVKYTAQTLTDAQKTQARTNIGAGTSNFNGNYNALSNAPPIEKSSGAYAAAGGYYSTASGQYGFAFGNRIVTSHNGEVAFGKHNESSEDTAFAIGDGRDTQYRHNLMELKTDGTLLLNGNAVKTEGEDDNKLRLGQITANGKYGFGGLFTVTSTTTVTFLTTDVPLNLTASGTPYKFGDFYVYSSSGIKIAPIAGYIGISKTGQWIHAENCYAMFYNCVGSAMTSFDVSMLDTSEVKNMGNMFYNCSALTSIDLSTFDTSEVKNMGGMFYGCSSLTSLDLSSIDTGKVESMYNMFNNCSALTTLDLSSFDTSNVQSMSYMFEDCNALTSVNLSSFDTSKVTSVEHMFYGCTALKTLDLSSFDMTNVTNASFMFGQGGVTLAGITTLKTPKINPLAYISLPRTLYSQDGTAYTNLPVTTGTSIELRRSWT